MADTSFQYKNWQVNPEGQYMPAGEGKHIQIKGQHIPLVNEVRLDTLEYMIKDDKLRVDIQTITSKAINADDFMQHFTTHVEAALKQLEKYKSIDEHEYETACSLLTDELVKGKVKKGKSLTDQENQKIIDLHKSLGIMSSYNPKFIPAMLPIMNPPLESIKNEQLRLDVLAIASETIEAENFTQDFTTHVEAALKRLEEYKSLDEHDYENACIILTDKLVAEKKKNTPLTEQEKKHIGTCHKSLGVFSEYIPYEDRPKIKWPLPYDPVFPVQNSTNNTLVINPDDSQVQE